MHPQPESLGPFMAPAPVLGDEAQGRAALIEAGIFQGRELIQTSEHQGTRANSPGVSLQPGALRHSRVQESIAEMDYQAKDSPHAEIPSDQQTHQQGVVLPLTLRR